MIKWLLSDLKTVPQNGIKVMSTFACGGGSTMGYKLAGCQVIAANDIDPEMAWHYKLNHNPQYYYLCPIKDLLALDLPKELYNLDILDGSPPCSTFSTSGKRERDWGKEKHFREGQSKQVLSDLFFDYLDLVEHLRPKVAIAENVTGIIKGNAKGYAKLILERFRTIGYKVQVFQISAAKCGVPQSRERVFFCALREDIKKPNLVLNPQCSIISPRQATSDLDLTAGELDKVKHTANTDLTWWPLAKEGECYADAIERFNLKRKSFNHYRLNGQFPSITLAASHSKFNHWDEPRQLTLREWIRLGTFPDDYQFKTDNIGKYMIGMSVPPRMMEQVVKGAIGQWLS